MANMKKISILIADDHAIVRTGLTSLLSTKPGLEVLGEARNGEDAVAKALRLKPDLVIMDLVMPKKGGVDAIREISEKMPGCRILVLTTFATSAEMSKALANGAQSAIMKSASNSELVAAIRATAEGKRVISQEISRMIAEDPPVPEISGRQLQILESIARGLTNREIAMQFNISPDSVKTHITRVMGKIGAANRSEAAAIALRKHLLKI